MEDSEEQDESKEQILSNFLSKDSHRIWRATWAVIQTDDAETLVFLANQRNQIRNAVKDIELEGVFLSNRDAFGLALRKLAMVKAGARCFCKLYPKDLRFNPVTEQERENIRILNEGGTADVY